MSDAEKYGTRAPLRSTSCPCGRVRVVEGNTSGTLRVYCACIPPFAALNARSLRAEASI